MFFGMLLDATVSRRRYDGGLVMFLVVFRNCFKSMFLMFLMPLRELERSVWPNVEKNRKGPQTPPSKKNDPRLGCLCSRMPCRFARPQDPHGHWSFYPPSLPRGSRDLVGWGSDF